jgi:hypothetical protein
MKPHHDQDPDYDHFEPIEIDPKGLLISSIIGFALIFLIVWLW